MQTKILFFIFLFVAFSSSAGDGVSQINIQHQGHDDHTEHYLPADAPEVYFDADNMAISIEADGYASYYEVDIISRSTLFTAISTQVGGYGDNVDVSSLPADEYSIVITSSNHNVYEGYFTVE